MCATCHGPLLSRQSKIYCSRDCYERRAAGGRDPSRYRTCEICSRDYHASYTEQRTCSRACGVELRRREGSLERTIWPSCQISYANCEHCGTLFICRNGLSATRYCSKTCGDRAYNQGRPRRWQPGERSCMSCGLSVADGRWKCDDCRVLSKRAAKQRRRRAERARRLGIEREPYTLAEIAQRDHYRCGLCRKAVAMTKPVPHPKAPTIDHVVPIACGGNDTRANVQLAHFICNSRKHTGGSQQLALMG